MNKYYTSKYRGVHQTFPTRRWEAQFRKSGKPTSLGCFNTEEEAARAYDTMMALTDNSVRPQTADVAVSNTAMTSDLKMALFQLLKCIHNVSVSV